MDGAEVRVDGAEVRVATGLEVRLAGLEVRVAGLEVRVAGLEVRVAGPEVRVAVGLIECHGYEELGTGPSSGGSGTTQNTGETTRSHTNGVATTTKHFGDGGEIPPS